MNFKIFVNYNKLENIVKLRIVVSSCRFLSSSSNVNRIRRFLDLIKLVIMGEKEQFFIFIVINVNILNFRKRFFDRFQVDLNKVQRDILGMVSILFFLKGQYNILVFRDYIVLLIREYVVLVFKVFIDVF